IPVEVADDQGVSVVHHEATAVEGGALSLEPEVALVDAEGALGGGAHAAEATARLGAELDEPGDAVAEVERVRAQSEPRAVEERVPFQEAPPGDAQGVVVGAGLEACPGRRGRL